MLELFFFKLSNLYLQEEELKEKNSDLERRKAFLDKSLKSLDAQVSFYSKYGKNHVMLKNCAIVCDYY